MTQLLRAPTHSRRTNTSQCSIDARDPSLAEPRTSTSASLRVVILHLFSQVPRPATPRAASASITPARTGDGPASHLPSIAIPGRGRYIHICYIDDCIRPPPARRARPARRAGAAYAPARSGASQREVRASATRDRAGATLMLARLPAHWREFRAGAVDFAPVRISRQRDPISRWRDFRASVRQSALLYMHASAPDFAPARCSRRRARNPRWRTDPQLL